jgi:suppressor for copper-sensitivity B
MRTAYDASSHLPTSANLDMLKPRFRPVLCVLATAMMLATFARPNFAGDDTFRDPLTGKIASTKRAGRPSRPALLKVTLTEDKNDFLLSIHLDVPPGGHTYSTDSGFSGATRIKLVQTDGVEPVDEKFTTDHEPKSEFQDGEMVEKFKDAVTWQRRFRLKPDAKRSDVRILSQVRYQICDALSCTPYDETFFATTEAPAEVIASDPAKLAEFKARFQPAAPATPAAPKVAEVEEESAAAPKPFEIKLVPQRGKVADPVKVRFRLSPEDAKPGQAALLSVTMELDAGWHTFALDQDPKNAGLPTLIELTSLNGLKAAEEKFSPSLAPEIAKTDDGKSQRVHHKEITWTMPVSVEKAEYGIAGTLRYQICREGQCRPLKGVPFELGHLAKVVEPPKRSPEITTVPPPQPPPIDPPPSGETGSPTIGGERIVPRAEQQSESLGLFLVYAFLGGLILNVMPCVLPVIAIKVLSFVQQAGQSRGRVLLLNLTYSLGVIAVFLLLASLAVFAKLGWGNLFQQTEFQVAMSCVVFAMGLSLMGVFEIPVPGMIGSAAGHQHQEGPFGAFLTGIFATLLATPCSGPFLGVTLGWSVKQPAHITYLVWAVMGLGMASPYILLGFMPGWVKFLPKPGNWMVTFKEVCGFILMGTVIFLMSSLKANWLLPLLILLLSIGFSLWMIGNLYTINSPDRRRWTVRTLAALVSGLGCWMAMGLADEKPGTHELPWQAFDGVKLKEELRKGRTVFVDFTADWCLACKSNKKLAYNTADTLERVKKHNIVAMKADWTDGSPAIEEWLNAFDSVSIPLAAIFPANDPLHPIILRDIVVKNDFLRKLDEAVEIKADTKLTQR